MQHIQLLLAIIWEVYKENIYLYNCKYLGDEGLVAYEYFREFLNIYMVFSNPKYPLNILFQYQRTTATIHWIVSPIWLSTTVSRRRIG